MLHLTEVLIHNTLLHTLIYVCIYAHTFSQLAAAVAMNGDLPRAEILHREALSMMERTLAPDDPRIAEVLFNLSAVVGGQRGRLGETENILHRCLEAQRRLHGVGERLDYIHTSFGGSGCVSALPALFFRFGGFVER